MTEKTPQNKEETSLNTPTTFAGPMDTARDSEPKSRALPQVDALKVRFKAGGIPLQTDFADLIDLANMGRQAVGGTENQTGPANGFTLSSEGRLELKPNEAKGISVEQDGVAVKLKTISGLTMDKDGVSVMPKADSGIELKDSAGISLKPGNGISVDKDGIAVKAEGNKGLQVTNNGVSIKGGNGIAVDSSGVNIKLAKGSLVNGGGGQGADGATSGSNGGLNLTANGLSVDAGSGIQIDPKGVSLKLAANSGLSADETNGLKIISEGGVQIGGKGISAKVNTSKGLTVNQSNGIEIKDGWGVSFGSLGHLEAKAGNGINVDSDGINVKTGNGITVTSSGVNIKLAKGSQVNEGGGQGADGATSGSNGGLNLTANGLSVDAGSGIQIDPKGVSIKLAANSGLSADETNGLKVVPEQMFQKGMVMMFSGSGIPSGWALCDGSGGRPDLRNRFVLGASGLGNIGQTNGKTVTGTDTNKQFTVNTDSKTPAVSVKVNGHKLTIAQMPAHNHSIKSAGNEGGDGQAIFEKKGKTPSFKTSFIKPQGSGEAHSHGASGSQSSHSHSVNVVPPYYILAFIIKL